MTQELTQRLPRVIMQRSTRRTRRKRDRLAVMVLLGLVGAACGSDATPDGTTAQPNLTPDAPGSEASAGGSAIDKESTASSASTKPDPTPAGAAAGQSDATDGGGMAQAGKPMSSPAANGGAAGSGSTSSPGPTMPSKKPEMLDPAVDWTALKIVYPVIYSAYDGVHKFHVPLHVEDTKVELSDWSAIPSDAVQFDDDPEGGGVMITVLKPTSPVTIAVRSGSGAAAIGGTAMLNVTSATPEQWQLGKDRYTTGSEWNPLDQYSDKIQDKLPAELKGMSIEMINMLTADQLIEILGPVKFAELLLQVPEWLDMELTDLMPAPTNTKCTNCHSTGAKIFEVQHTPTQIAQVSDADLITIFTKGMKPASIGFRVLPTDLQETYAQMHQWMASDEEVKALVVYLRSLTPEGQGDFLGPDGKYYPVTQGQGNSSLADLIAQGLADLVAGKK